MSELDLFDKRFRELQEKIITCRDGSIFKLQKQYNVLLEEFRKWAQNNRLFVPAEKRVSKAAPDIFKIDLDKVRKG